MYMRVVRARMDPTRIDEVAGQVGPDLAAAIKRLPGYQNVMSGVDRANGQTILVSTWDSEEHARYPLEALSNVLSRLSALGVQAAHPRSLR